MEDEKGRRRNAPRGESARVIALENPLDFIAEDHMREREVCAMIDRFVAAGGLPSAELNPAVDFLKVRLPEHLADEEMDLFPLMLKRCEPEDEIDKVIEKLLSDHGHAIADAEIRVA